MPKDSRVAMRFELEWSYKYHAAMFAGAEQYGQERGWMSSVDEYIADTLPAKRTGKVPYDGVLARADKRLAERAARLDLPLVNVWFSSPVRDQLPGVFLDFAALGRMRAEHLLSRGLRRFAIVTAQNVRSDAVELKEFLATIDKTGNPCVTTTIPMDFSATLVKWRSTQQALTQWMAQWELPIGVVVFPDDISRTVAQMCRARSWRVPQDVAIIAGYNEETICEYARPTFTSIEPHYHRIGFQAAALLDRLMSEKAKGRNRRSGKSKQETEREHILSPPQGLIVRESTDFFTSDNPEVARVVGDRIERCREV